MGRERERQERENKIKKKEKVISQSGKVNCVENKMRKEKNDKLSKILCLFGLYIVCEC